MSAITRAQVDQVEQITAAITGMLMLLFTGLLFRKLYKTITGPGNLSSSEIRDMVQQKVLGETRWGEDQYGKKVWAKESWGKIVGRQVTLFHGTDPGNVPRILREGLTAGYDIPPEELEGEELAPPAVWLAATPYLAFFFGDAAVQVTIPLEWIAAANDGLLVTRDIPAGMTGRVMLIGEWK